MLSNKIKKLLASSQSINSKKYDSPDAVRIALGLKDWEEFKISVIQSAKESNLSKNYLDELLSGRCSGRTTKMLVDAIYESQFRKIAIKGYSDRYSHQLVESDRRMCLQLNLNPDNIIFPSSQANKPERGIQTFSDHYYDIRRLKIF